MIRSRFHVPRSSLLLWAGWLLSSSPVLAQSQPQVAGTIEFFGIEKVSRAALVAALGMTPGDTIPRPAADRARVIQRLTAVNGVESAELYPVCCENNREILYVGIVERGAPQLKFHRAPTGRAKVADTLRALSDSFFNRMIEGIREGQSEDDMSQGHSLLAYAPARAVQEEVLRYTAAHEGELRKVLRQSADEESRAIAAWALGYAPDKHSVIPDLVAAARDPYDEVRNNAIRALSAIGRLAQLKPELGLAVPAQPLLQLMHSPIWTDRNKTSLALMMLTDRRDPALLNAIRAQATVPLVEMARWKTGHAMAPYFVVTRMLGVSDSAAFTAYQRGDRESILQHALH